MTAGAIPTNDGLTCVFVGTTPERFRAELVPQPKSGFASLLAEGAPELVDRMSGARAPSQLRRFPGRPGHVRQSWGPGWALVGDAGYWKDPLSAHGLTDALRDAELLARAVVAGLDDGDLEAAELAGYQATRDRLSMPLFDTTEAIAGYGWDADAISALLLQLSSAMTDEVEAVAALDVTWLRRRSEVTPWHPPSTRSSSARARSWASGPIPTTRPTSRPGSWPEHDATVSGWWSSPQPPASSGPTTRRGGRPPAWGRGAVTRWPPAWPRSGCTSTVGSGGATAAAPSSPTA